VKIICFPDIIWLKVLDFMLYLYLVTLMSCFLEIFWYRYIFTRVATLAM